MQLPPLKDVPAKDAVLGEVQATAQALRELASIRAVSEDMMQRFAVPTKEANESDSSVYTADKSKPVYATNEVS